jgi:hypothetical protein
MISEHLNNLKRLAVTGKQLPWCIDAGLIKEWGGRIARFNPLGWLPIDYCGCLGIGGRNGVEIAPGVALQASGAAQSATPTPAPTPVTIGGQTNV